MNILIVGSGAREHAIAKALKKSSEQPLIYCYGTSLNPGIKALCKDYEVGDINHVDSIVKKAWEWNIELTIIGPETPLEKGLADALSIGAIPTIGPKKVLAQLETSKSFTRELLKKYSIPGSPHFKVFQSLAGVKEFLHELGENR